MENIFRILFRWSASKKNADRFLALFVNEWVPEFQIFSIPKDFWPDICDNSDEKETRGSHDDRDFPFQVSSDENSNCFRPGLSLTLLLLGFSQNSPFLT